MSMTFQSTRSHLSIFISFDWLIYLTRSSFVLFCFLKQSDVVHQSVYELVHSEDREELQRQLTWNSQLGNDSGLSLVDALRPDNSTLLERSFTVRFRCLLDNTSGFLVRSCPLLLLKVFFFFAIIGWFFTQRLDIRGRIKVLHGQNRKTEEPPLALFAICTPFGPPSLLELPHKESMFKSKHRLDLALVSIDQRYVPLLFLLLLPLPHPTPTPLSLSLSLSV